MTKHRLIEDSPEDARRAQDAWRREIEEARERQDDAHDAVARIRTRTNKKASRPM